MDTFDNRRVPAYFAWIRYHPVKLDVRGLCYFDFHVVISSRMCSRARRRLDMPPLTRTSLPPLALMRASTAWLMNAVIVMTYRLERHSPSSRRVLLCSLPTKWRSSPTYSREIISTCPGSSPTTVTRGLDAGLAGLTVPPVRSMT